MEADSSSPPMDDIEAWSKAPWLIKLIIAQLEAWMPHFLVTSNAKLREGQPLLHAVLVVVLVALLYALSFYYLHRYLYRHLAGYYPLMRVLFSSRPAAPPSVSKVRGRSHRPSPTSYRGSKFSTARSVKSSLQLSDTQLST